VVRVTVWVRPGSPRPGVGGEHDGALVVRVSARAVDGRATAAALAAVAAAFGVRRHDVTLVAGAANRKKIVDVAGADPAVLDRLLALDGLSARWLGDEGAPALLHRHQPFLGEQPEGAQGGVAVDAVLLG
jgi:uncharacterized protein